MRPEIARASMKEEVCEIDCVDGTVEVVAEDGRIRLDNEREITIQELSGVAEGYWKEWSEHWKQVRKAKDREG